MANEGKVVVSININKNALKWQNGTRTFTFTITGTKGPTPGAVSVPTTGKDIYLDQLTTPGFCMLTNLDPTNYVEVGVRGPTERVILSAH